MSESRECIFLLQHCSRTVLHLETRRSEWPQVGEHGEQCLLEILEDLQRKCVCRLLCICLSRTIAEIVGGEGAGNLAGSERCRLR